jgi:molybdopterin-guanine dinucleotide biosynthesis protein B
VNGHTPPVVAVTGFRNVGKTTVIESLLHELTARGYGVATLKHSHCGFDIDRRGKDSWRHRQAGAMGTAMIGSDTMTVIRDGEANPRDAARWFFSDANLVLAEGFHWYPLDRIEVLDSHGDHRDAHPRGRVIGQLPYRYGEGDIQYVADALERVIHSSGSQKGGERKPGEETGESCLVADRATTGLC